MAYKIIPERCINCVSCVVFCPVNAIRYGGNQAYRIDPERCTECGSCLEHCNHDAIVDPGKPEPAVKLHPLITLDCDLCVIGGGPGVTAAVRAAQAGKKVVILEKGPQLGGCAWYAPGLFTRGSKAHLATGVRDNREDAVKEISARTKNKIDPTLLRKAIYSNGPFFDWVTEFKELDGRFTFRGGPGGAGGPPGGSGGENPMALEGPVGATGMIAGARYGVGRYIMNALRDNCKKLGVTVLTHHRAVEIVTNRGTVSYVMADDPGGQTRVNCKACLLSTGAFQANMDMIREYAPLFGDMRIGHNAHGLPENTGDGMALAQKAGAYIDKDAIRFDDLGQIPSPMSAFLCAHCKIDEMKISLLGKRFTNEASRMMMSEAVIQAQPQGVTYSISDQTLWDERNKAELEKDKGRVDPYSFTPEMMDEMDDFLNAPDQPLIRADTVEELANQMGVDSRIFTAAVKRYNRFCEDGKDEDFGKPAEHLHPVKTPPFYAVRNLVHPHGGSCGVAVNTNMEVKAANGGIIPGFYASGDVVSPSLGSRANVLHDLTWAFTGAFMAADSILEYLKTKS